MDDTLLILQQLVGLLEGSEANNSKALKQTLNLAKSRIAAINSFKRPEESSCFRLAYSSHLLASESELQDIVVKAVKKNQLMGVTGALIHKDKCLIQLLEGPQDNVLSLCERIKYDKRHKDFKIIMKSSKQIRLFPDWSMANFKTSPNSFDAMLAILKELDELQYAVTDLEHGIKPFSKPNRIVRYVSM